MLIVKNFRLCSMLDGEHEQAMHGYMIECQPLHPFDHVILGTSRGLDMLLANSSLLTCAKLYISMTLHCVSSKVHTPPCKLANCTEAPLMQPLWNISCDLIRSSLM